MNQSNLAVKTIQYSNFEGLIERQYLQYLLDMYPQISVETQIWTGATRPYMQNSFLIMRALLKVNIVNIHSICTLKFPLKLQYEL
jgi:hypothetical protein